MDAQEPVKFHSTTSRLLNSLAEEIISIQDLDVLLSKILSYTRLISNADAGIIFIKTKDNRLKVSQAQNNKLESESKDGAKNIISSLLDMPIKRTFLPGYAASTGKTLNIADAYQIPAESDFKHFQDLDTLTGYKTISTLCVPLKAVDGSILGVLQLVNAISENGNIIPFTSEVESEVSIFASFASAAIQKAQVFRAVIDRMIDMSALCDPMETAVHSNRVAILAVALYRCWAYSTHQNQAVIDKNCELLRIAAMLHDVGKVGVSDLILKKPGKLNERERCFMESHCVIGYRLFKNALSDYEIMARDIALRHHENWDGSGYPGKVDIDSYDVTSEDHIRAVGLKGEEIPFFARIVSICDVYDALSHKRCYKEAWSEDAVFNELAELAGKKFDPSLIDCFFKLRSEIPSLIKQFNE